MTTTPEFKTSAERMRFAWEQSGKTQTEIAEYCGVERAAVNKWMPPDPDSSANLPLGENLRKFGEVTGFNTHWLLTGEGSPRIDEESKSPLAVSKSAQLLQCLQMIESHPLLRKVSLAPEIAIELAKRLQSFLKPDGSIDLSKLIEVIANPYLGKPKASRKDTNNEVEEKGGSHARKRVPDT
ncbi:MAG TPA: helix-turn-helix transcriptional regulator [Burkholderiales bacterium]|nr:helix-turn-helix transcriptional regulator [Burkholderiales bacterium]